MNYVSGYGNMLAELAGHITRFFLLAWVYRYVLAAAVPGLPVLDWRMGVMIYAVLALAFTINLRFGSD
jgi:hypothetical protein